MSVKKNTYGYDHLLELPNTLPQSMQDIVGAFKMDEHGIEQCVGQAMPCATNEGPSLPDRIW